VPRSLASKHAGRQQLRAEDGKRRFRHVLVALEDLGAVQLITEEMELFIGPDHETTRPD